MLVLSSQYILHAFIMETETLTIVMTTIMDVAGNETAISSNIATIKLATKVINILILTMLMVSMGCTIDLKDFKGTVGTNNIYYFLVICLFRAKRALMKYMILTPPGSNLNPR